MTMAGVPKVKPTYGYYRQPDGFITASPATDTDELQYRRDGWTPLRQYGYFEMATAYAANNPLEALFIRGGAHELSVRQIREQGLYIEPPLIPTCGTPLNQDHRRHAGCFDAAKPVVFPQIAGLTDLGPFPCRMGCDRQLPTVEARNQHEGVAHKPEKSDERTGRSLADALIEGLGGRKLEPVEQTGSEASAETFLGPAAAYIARLKQEMQEIRGELAALKTVKRRRGPNRAKVPA